MYIRIYIYIIHEFMGVLTRYGGTPSSIYLKGNVPEPYLAKFASQVLEAPAFKPSNRTLPVSTLSEGLGFRTQTSGCRV